MQTWLEFWWRRTCTILEGARRAGTSTTTGPCYSSTSPTHGKLTKVDVCYSDGTLRVDDGLDLRSMMQPWTRPPRPRQPTPQHGSNGFLNLCFSSFNSSS